MTMISRSSQTCPYCGQTTIDGPCTRHAVYGKGEQHEQDRLFSPVKTSKGQTTMEGMER